MLRNDASGYNMVVISADCVTTVPPINCLLTTSACCVNDLKCSVGTFCYNVKIAYSIYCS